MPETTPQPAPRPPTWADPIRDRINNELVSVIAAARFPDALADAAAYAALQGGKRLRPLLCWLCAAAVRGEGADGQRFGLASLPAGCATELVHAFSLVHDDLPALDDDDLRRGRPTLHVHAGEAMAVLAGDALLALAFGVLDRVADAVLRDALRHELVRGTLGMIGGQVRRSSSRSRRPAGTSPPIWASSS
jgi:geranylgeranyl pyrophosphate synthase